MKRILAAAMAVMMLFGATACNLTNKEFKKITDNVTSAAKEVWDASKASSAQKKAFKSANFTSNPAIFSEAAYYTCEKKDVKVSNLDSSSIKKGEFTDIYFFCKTEDDSLCMAQVTALKSEKLAQSYYEELVDELGEGVTEENLEKEKEIYDIEYCFEDTDNEFICTEVLESAGVAISVYLKCDGKNVIAIVYNGVSGDFLDEYYDFVDKCGYADLESMVE